MSPQCRSFIVAMLISTSTLSAQVFNIFPQPQEGNAGVGTGPGPLNRVHIHATGDNLGAQAVLRFSYGDATAGQSPVVNDAQHIAQLALPRNNAAIFSQSAQAGDFVIRTTQQSGRLILSTQRPGSPILFTTSVMSMPPGALAQDYPLVSISNGTELPARTPLPAPPPNSINGRMVTMPGVHLGVECLDPKDALQVGSRLTLHPGYNFNYIGYNQYTQGGTNILRRISGVPDAIDNPSAVPPIQSGHASGLMFMRSGDAILYSAGEDAADAQVRVWQEPEWFVRGVSVGPDGLVGVGLIAPRPTSSPVSGPTARLTIRGLLGQQHSYGAGTTNTFTTAERAQLYALRVITGDGFDLISARDDRRVGIGNLQPRDILQIGDLITFHDGGSKFMGFNTYYNGQSNRLENIQGGRASVTIGVGDAVSNPSVFAIRIDQNQSIGPVMTSFKGLSMNATGNVGIGAESPTARLDVLGSVNNVSNILVARGMSNTGSRTFLVVTSDGNVGVNTQTPKSTLHVQGDVTIGSNQCTNAHPGFTNKLSVDGIIFTKEVRVVPSTWADDVFKSGYHLPTLTQVEEHIKTHGHLQGIPSEAQATKDGVDVSAMQAALLRKVEELTLYVIALEKKVASLSAESSGAKP
jgi:hypothetical protein